MFVNMINNSNFIFFFFLNLWKKIREIKSDNIEKEFKKLGNPKMKILCKRK